MQLSKQVRAIWPKTFFFLEKSKQQNVTVMASLHDEQDDILDI